MEEIALLQGDFYFNLWLHRGDCVAKGDFALVKSLIAARRLPTASDRATTAGRQEAIGAAAAGAEAPFLFCISWSADQASWSWSASSHHPCSPSPQPSSLPQASVPLSLLEGHYYYQSRVTRARVQNLLEASGGLPPGCHPWRRTWPPRSATPSCTTVVSFVSSTARLPRGPPPL